MAKKKSWSKENEQKLFWFLACFGALHPMGLRLCAWTAVLLIIGCRGSTVRSTASPATEWQEIREPDWHFQASMPGPPRKELQTSSPNPQLQLILTAGDVTYLVAANAVPTGLDEPAKAKLFLDAARDRTLSNNQAKLLDDKPLSLAPRFVGRELHLTTAGGEDRRMRLYLANGFFYVLTIQGTREATTSKNADKFLDSFQLTDGRQ